MITRKVQLIKRKLKFSDLLLDEKELRLIRFIETQAWMCDITVTITKSKLLEKDIAWLKTVESLKLKFTKQK